MGRVVKKPHKRRAEIVAVERLLGAARGTFAFLGALQGAAAS